MHIVIHCGGMPFNGETIKTQSLGGSETAAYYMAKELAALGHVVTMFTNTQEEGAWDGVKYVGAGQVNEQSPLGSRFHFYAMNTPHDVLIIQRAPSAFAHKWASKLNVCWLHDLGLHRQKDGVLAAAWNIDAFLTVSEFHKKQIVDVWGVNPDVVRPITNGVDLSLFAKSFDGRKHFKLDGEGKIRLLYSSRPERGLEHLVREGGIMERLHAVDPRIHLYVCNYDNKVPQMADFYGYLFERIEELPNCSNIGHLTKQELADAMRQADALVYPTEFEEVSCITAMEAMAAGLPFISSEHAALPETCKDSGAHLIPLKDGQADEDAFCEYVAGLANKEAWDKRRETQREAAKRYDWKNSAKMVDDIVKGLFETRARNPESLLAHLIWTSDIYAADRYASELTSKGLTPQHSPALDELAYCYKFAFNRTWREHYDAYYEYEKARGVNYGPERLEGNTRYESVAKLVAAVRPGGVVLDYGCAHGHYTINLAKRFPDRRFVGIDITASNIDKARAWAEADGVANVEFRCGAVEEGHGDTGAGPQLRFSRLPGEAEDFTFSLGNSFDAVIAAEVLEHLESPAAVADALAQYLKPTGTMIVTTPIGPWEAQGYAEHYPRRMHVHHLERADLKELFGHHPGYKVNLAPSGRDRRGDVLGSYITSFKRPKHKSGSIDYDRKLRHVNPRQSLAVCVIARDAGLTLAKCLESVKDIAQEIIVGVDRSTKDDTRDVARRYAKGMSDPSGLVFDIDSPLSVGFDEARNQVIAKAKADWILWIDADEVLYHPENVVKYLRENQYAAYAVRQHHFSVVPAMILKTDLPTRLFRNGKGVRFFGLVHEHPEVELNKGIGHVMLLPDVAISHHGYSTEEIRRGRFNRNIELLVRDREKYPDRMLGKFLWIRDLAQMSTYEMEVNGGVVTEEMVKRAEIGIKLWEELLQSGQLRMLLDGMVFYSTLVSFTGGGFDFGFQMDASKLNGDAHPERAQPIKGRFATREHAEILITKLLKERTANYESRYF